MRIPILKQIDAYRLHLIKSGILSFGTTLVWVAMMIYQVQVVGMTPLQLVLAGTALEITIFLFEIPTGIVADVYSRKLSAAIGYSIVGLSYILQGLIPAFGAILAGHFLWGVGYTFTSGAYDAWLVDELGQDRAPNAFLRGAQVDRAAGIFGILASVALGSIMLAMPIVIGGIIIIGLAVYMALFMPENGFAPAPTEDRSTFGKMKTTLSEGIRVIRGQPVLISILAVGFFYGLFSEGWDRLWQAHFLRTFGLGENMDVPVIVIFGAFDIIGMVLGIIITEIVRRRVNTTNPRQVAGALVIMTLLMVVSLFLFGLAPVLAVALIAFFVFTQSREQIVPIMQIWSNQHIASHVRATVLSLQSQSDAIGQIAGGPPVGMIGNWSLRAAFIASGLMLTPALAILQRSKRHEPTVVPAEAETI
ncbi:MAG: MFS transporter [Anaerolineae bacterium]|nr:MFS transporter [Anaerolineae bacterium]